MSRRPGLSAGYATVPGVHAEPRDGFTPGGQEYWKPNGAYYLLANQQIHRALAHFR